MRLDKLINGACKVEIGSITDDVSKVKKGSLFIARQGSTRHGAEFAEQAVRQGAVAVVTDKQVKVDVPVYYVNDAVAETARLAGVYYSHPQRDLKLVTVVGTNGKTTVANLVYQTLNALGMRAGVIGTLGAEWNGKRLDTGLTTPGCIEFVSLLAQMRDDGVKYVVAEVSAHAISQRRLQGICADVAIFTNLSQDHLDYYGTMQEYARAKQSYFVPEYTGCAVVNADDELGRHIIASAKIPVVSYGVDCPCDAFAIDVADGERLTFFANVLDDVREYSLRLHGKFNVYNALAVLTTMKVLGFDLAEVNAVSKMLKPVRGRFEVVALGKGRAIIDYAHTPDALENVLRSLEEEAKGKLVCVFGCGGDRDKSKRKLMGEVAEKYADEIVLTSDNSRSERPEDIIRDVAIGIKGEKRVIISRKEAIFYALDNFSGDTVLIAGKGAEEYIEQNGEKIPFSDISVVREWLEAHGIDD